MFFNIPDGNHCCFSYYYSMQRQNVLGQAREPRDPKQTRGTLIHLLLRCSSSPGLTKQVKALLWALWVGEAQKQAGPLLLPTGRELV